MAPVVRIYSEPDPILIERTQYGESYAYYRIYVTDNGIGFDQKYAEQIFEISKRLHHHDEYEGTGIGLAFCKKIVEQQDGFISARSEPDQGATFIVSLPSKSTLKKEKEAASFN